MPNHSPRTSAGSPHGRQSFQLLLRFATILASLMLVLALTACSGSGGGGNGEPEGDAQEQGDETEEDLAIEDTNDGVDDSENPALVTVRVEVRIPSTNLVASTSALLSDRGTDVIRANVASPQDVKSIWVRIHNPNSGLDETDLPLSNAGWEELALDQQTGVYFRDFSGLTDDGTALEFYAEAFDSLNSTSGNKLFQASTTVNPFTAGTVTLYLIAVNQPALSSFPIIHTITLPVLFVPGTPDNITVSVEGGADEALDWEISESEGGVFTPLSGTLQLTGGATTGDVIVAFDPPAAEGYYAQRFTLRNTGGVSISAQFYTRVELTAAGAGLHIFFQPVLAGIDAERTANNDIAFSANVLDDKPVSTIDYSWGFTPNGPSANPIFEDSGVNPAS